MLYQHVDFSGLPPRGVCGREGGALDIYFDGGVPQRPYFWRQYVLRYFNIEGQYVLIFLQTVPKDAKVVENGGQHVLIR